MVGLEDNWNYPNYSRDMQTSPSKPCELKHVYDTVKDEYVVNELNACYYSPKIGCRLCTHKGNCILDGDNWSVFDKGRLGALSREKRDIRGLIDELRVVLEEHRNGVVVYHDFIGELYDVRIDGVVDDDGWVRFHVGVFVVDDFRGRVRSRIRELELELRLLAREEARL